MDNGPESKYVSLDMWVLPHVTYLRTRRMHRSATSLKTGEPVADCCSFIRLICAMN